MPQNKVYVGAVGGMGDILYEYFNNGSWRSLPGYKEKHPDSIVRAIIVSHNPAAKELVKHNPYIDEVIWQPPKREMRDLGWTHKQVMEQYADGYSLLPNVDWSIMPVYTSEEEQKFLENYKHSKIAVIHPFASDSRRIPCGPHEYIPAIKKLIDKRYIVFMLGASYLKTFGPTEGYLKEEKFDWSHPTGRFINGIDKIGPRLAVNLIARANMFIGTWSCYGVTSWMLNTRTIMVIPEELYEGCYRIYSGKYHKEQKTQNHFVTASQTGWPISDNIKVVI